jgi:AcrR family transcriptional regulator
MATTTGLRERSKTRRRAAITRAAFQLFAERGYEATTIADIAEAAEVSPRTIAMYFPVKQDIAMSRVSEVVASLTDALHDKKPGETVTDALGRWLLTSQTEPDDHAQRLLAHRMFAANPQLAALRAARLAAALRDAAAAVAADTGAAPDDIGPRLAAAAAGAMINEVLGTEPGAQRREAVESAMRFIQAGLAAL